MSEDKTGDQRLAEVEKIHIGGSPADTQATLCIYADHLNPDEVTALVQCSPTESRRKGERLLSRPKVRPAIIGQWFLEAPRSLSLNAKIQYLLDATTSDENAWRALRESHTLELRVAVFLASWNEGFELSHETIAAISARRWTLGLSMFSADGDDIINSFLRRGRYDQT